MSSLTANLTCNTLVNRFYSMHHTPPLLQSARQISPHRDQKAQMEEKNAELVSMESEIKQLKKRSELINGELNENKLLHNEYVLECERLQNHVTSR